MMNFSSLFMKSVGCLALAGLLACGASGGPEEPQEPQEAAEEEEDDGIGTVTQGLAAGGGGTGSSCSAPPLQCGGSISRRGVYPGCSVTCGPGETAMCLSGSCFWGRAGVCTCQGAIYYPQ